MSMPDSISASQLCKYLRHILGKYSQRAHASVYSAQLPHVYQPWEPHSTAVGFTVFKKPHTDVKEDPQSVKTPPLGVVVGLSSRQLLSWRAYVSSLKPISKSPNRWPTRMSQLFRKVSCFVEVAVCRTYRHRSAQSIPIFGVVLFSD